MRRARYLLCALAAAACSELAPTPDTSFDIEVRFFGPAPSATQQALFTNAAARIESVVTGDLPNVAARSLGGGPMDLAEVCDISGLPIIEETIDDLIVYAAIRPIDGAGRVLARASPCVMRGGALGTVALGTLILDSEDLSTLGAGGRLQSVITHEMLHVLGFGTLWDDRGLIADEGQETVTYLGAQARADCIASGGLAACATGVPVDNSGTAGTVDGHWREATFFTELMTGFVEQGAMPLSIITIGALADLGYTVSRASADPYVVPALRASARRSPAELAPGWEQPASARLWRIAPDGRLERLRP